MLFEKQKYQEDCVSNIVNVLKDYDFSLNDIDVLKNNLRQFYSLNNDIPMKDLSDKLKLDVLMETGTGKTFAYIKTMFELNKNYNLNKFIVFVPRKAIREGVIQNIKLTSDYFFESYGKRLYKYTYDSDKSIGNIKSHYIRNKDELSVLILTASSIDKEKNILRRSDENLFKDKSIFDAITKINPIVFIDEPHLLKGEAFSKIFSDFNSLHIRFGATYPSEQEHSLSNLIYALDSLSSFKNMLVKKIRVNTIINNENALKVVSVSSRKKEAEVLYFYNNEEHKRIIRFGEDLGVITGVDTYNGIKIVNCNKSEVFLSNNRSLKVSDKYELSDDEVRMMIRKTIETHFSKEEYLFEKNIKTLSLFFIRSVSDFRGENPAVKKIFEEEYVNIRNRVYQQTSNLSYKKYLEGDFDKEQNLRVHEGYFSGDKGSSIDDKVANGIDIILNDKEKLLSLNTPLRFIFSVWALQEGWDNPNIFTLCKLSNTDKETSRRQQIGRGLRIAVNQDGRRLTYNYLNEDKSLFYKINTLDVVVSGHEQQFINEIQKEIVDNSFIISTGYLKREMFIEKGFYDDELNRIFIALVDNAIIKSDNDSYLIISPIKDFLLNERAKLSFLNDSKYQNLLSLFDDSHDNFIENGNKVKEKVRVRQDKLDSFKELWETINRKSKIVYKNLDEEGIVKSIADSFNKTNIDKVTIKYLTQEYNPESNDVINKSVKSEGVVNFFKDGGCERYLIELAKNEKLPLHFILKLFNKIKLESIKNNPNASKKVLTEIIKDEIHKTIIQKVDYKFENEINITSTSLHDNGKYKTEVEYTEIGKFIDIDIVAPENFLFDKIIYDSAIEKNAILNDPQRINNKKIVVYAKLPKISIPTPYKTYNPDFAYLLETDDRKKLFLIVETKGYESENKIPNEEISKIEYAERFFLQLQKELGESVKIIYKKRINKQDLVTLLNQIETGD